MVQTETNRLNGRLFPVFETMEENVFFFQKKGNISSYFSFIYCSIKQLTQIETELEWLYLLAIFMTDIL